MVVRSRADAVAEATLDSRISSVVRTSGGTSTRRPLLLVLETADAIQLGGTAAARIFYSGFYRLESSSICRRITRRVDERETVNWLRIHFTQSAHGDIND
jgi:hypothetical protein